MIEEKRLVGKPSQSDENIAREAHAELNKYFWIPSGHIQLTVVDGWLTVDGHFEWLFEKTAVERLLRQVHGVRGISNLIVVDAVRSGACLK